MACRHTTPTLESLAELGPTGLLAFLSILGITANSLARTRHRALRSGDGLLADAAGAALIALIAYCSASVFLSSQLSRSLWLVLGVAVALERLTAVTKREAR